MVLSQNYIVKMAIFDLKYRHRKELRYRNFKDIFGNKAECLLDANIAISSSMMKQSAN